MTFSATRILATQAYPRTSALLSPLTLCARVMAVTVEILLRPQHISLDYVDESFLLNNTEEILMDGKKS